MTAPGGVVGACNLDRGRLVIRYLALSDIGPTRALGFEFSPRINVLTGDNGLGKTFVLDVLWWALTTRWVGQPALPWRPPPPPKLSPDNERGDHRVRFSERIYRTAERDEPLAPMVEALVVRAEHPEAESNVVLGHYRWSTQAWQHSWRKAGSDEGDALTAAVTPWRNDVTPPGLIVFARIDGSFAVWDAHQAQGDDEYYQNAAAVLGASELWHGKREDNFPFNAHSRTQIRGLLDDWVSWQGTNAPEFAALCETLTLLSDPAEPLIPGKPGRVFLNDRRDIPMLSMPYGDVPVTLASAGMKRVLGLAYLLVWSWSEHRKAAELIQREPVREMTLLIDEVELHLHPSWQRLLLPAVLRAIDKLAPDCAVQVFATTHSPMVLASLESVFDESVDDLFVLERDGQAVRVNDLPWAKEGDVSNWLLSDAFGKVGSRSREAELAIAAAKAFMEDRPDDAEQALTAFVERIDALPDTAESNADRIATVRGTSELAARIQAALEATLPGHDEFWVQWNLVYRLPKGRRGSAT